MAEAIYDEIEIEDMTFDPALDIYHYPCPCGDRFEITLQDLRDGEEVAVCPSCSLMIRVVFEVVSLLPPTFLPLTTTLTRRPRPGRITVGEEPDTKHSTNPNRSITHPLTKKTTTKKTFSLLSFHFIYFFTLSTQTRSLHRQ
jgi:diphthamide biosynthesis protein 3